MMTRSVSLITGASSGIGLQLSRQLAARGGIVVLSSRDATRLQTAVAQLRREFPRTDFEVCSEDLSATGAAQRLSAWMRARELSPDLLINNAGLGVFGEFASSDPQDIAEMLNVNIVALTDLSRAFLPAMLERKSGAIMHVGSIAGFCPGPMMSVYYASKAYVSSFSLALREECAGTGIKVSCLCPGPVRTRFQTRAGLSASKLARSTLMEADVVAREGLRGLERNQALIVPGRGNKLFALGARHAPPTLVAALVKGIQKRK